MGGAKPEPLAPGPPSLCCFSGFVPQRVKTIHLGDGFPLAPLHSAGLAPTSVSAMLCPSVLSGTKRTVRASWQHLPGHSCPHLTWAALVPCFPVVHSWGLVNLGCFLGSGLPFVAVTRASSVLGVLLDESLHAEVLMLASDKAFWRRGASERPRVQGQGPGSGHSPLPAVKGVNCGCHLCAPMP